MSGQHVRETATEKRLHKVARECGSVTLHKRAWEAVAAQEGFGDG